ncbi:MAG: hypothetical protein IPL63_16810 [Saprospiraceae bacterium]|nr:hypothetical protein [Saprospiraceae bacterium]
MAQYYQILIANLNTPNGSINLSTTGGVEPFTAIWGIILQECHENLRTGFYGVMATDANVGVLASNAFCSSGNRNITFYRRNIYGLYHKTV